MQWTKINNVKLFFSAMGIGSMLGVNVVMVGTWFTAYFNGGKVTIYINAYGEMLFELFFLPIMLGISIWSIYHVLRKV